MTWQRALSLLAAAWLVAGCGDDDGSSDNGNWNGNVNTTIDSSCVDVRFTRYGASDRGWCGFSRNLSILPDFVRSGLTFAMAEPWNGGSYGGEPGEGCGECWEITNSWASEIVMMHDLCPIEGNPVCAGEMLHFDLSTEADAALQTDGGGAATVRRVPCPVTGNIHVSIGDWNQWGYLKLAVVNHRVPIRQIDVRAVPDGTWIPLGRDLGRWSVLEGPEPGDGDGVVFRVASAQGQRVEGSNVLGFATVDPGGDDLLHDIGVQVEDLEPPEGVCEYVPPGLVYGDDWGGTPGNRWMPNPWGDTEVTEVGEGCHDGSTSCLRIDHMGPGMGVHLYVWQPFPTSAFDTLTVWARTLEGISNINVAPANPDGRCGEHEQTIDDQWTEIAIDVASICSDPELNTVTVSHGDGVPLLLDDIRYE